MVFSPHTIVSILPWTTPYPRSTTDTVALCPHLVTRYTQWEAFSSSVSRLPMDFVVRLEKSIRQLRVRVLWRRFLGKNGRVDVELLPTFAQKSDDPLADGTRITDNSRLLTKCGLVSKMVTPLVFVLLCYTLLSVRYVNKRKFTLHVDLWPSFRVCI